MGNSKNKLIKQEEIIMRKLRKQTLVAIMAAVLGVGAIAGCGSNGSNKAAQNETTNTTENGKSTELKEFRIGVPGQDDGYIAGLLNVAYYEGYLKEEFNEIGYEPSLVAALSGPILNESLAANEIDATVYGDFPALTAAANRLGNEIVAVIDSKYQYAILTSDKSNITKPSDFEGKTVSITQGSVLQFFWDQYAKANKIDTSSVNIVNATDMATLFQTGDIDAGVTTIASAYYMENTGIGAKIFDTGAENAYTTLVATVRGDLLEKDPKVGVAFNKALIRAYEAVKQDVNILYKDQVTPNMNEETWEKAQAFDSSLDNLKVQITDDTLNFYDELNQWLFDNKVISEKVDISKVVHTEYYDEAVKELEE